MALLIASGLEATQYDALNAFLNGKLPRQVFVRTPQGFRDQYDELLEL